MAIESLLVIIASTVPTPCPDYQHPSHLHQLRVSDKIIFLSIFLEHANYFNMQCAILTYLSNLPVKKLSVFAMNINENNHDSGRKKWHRPFLVCWVYSEYNKMQGAKNLQTKPSPAPFLPYAPG